MPLFTWLVSLFLVTVNGQTDYDVKYIPLFYEEYIKYDAIEQKNNNSCRMTYETHDLNLICPTDISCYLTTDVKNSLIDTYKLNNSTLDLPCNLPDNNQLPVNKTEQLNAVLEILRLTNKTVCEFSAIETLDVRRGGLVNMGQLGGAKCDDHLECPYQLTYLNVEFVKIGHLFNNSFCQFERLEYLGLIGCDIRSIEMDAFIYLVRLKEISLNQNQLSNLPFDLFKNNLQLQTVTLNQNKFGFYPINAILPVNSLRYLFINNNNLTFDTDFISFSSSLEQLTIDRNNLQNISLEFLNLKKLILLAIDRNNISEVAENAFFDLHEVKILNLGSNKIKNLGKNIFKNNLKLDILLLENNSLSNFPPIAHLEHLKALFLANNKLKFINKTDLINCTRLSGADFSGNQLTHIERGSFENVGQLRSLTLARNRLSQLSVDFKDSNILEINLDYNNFTAFSYQTFPHSLVRLTLAHNQIDTIEPFENSDLYTTELVLLVLTDNRIRTIKDLNIPVNLQILDLRRNRISTLCEKYFIKIRPISYHVSHNPLECTCENMWMTKPQPVDTLKFEDLDVAQCQQTNPYNKTKSIVPLTQLNEFDFLCQSDHSDSHRCQCPLFGNIRCDLPCPSNCTCLSNYERTIIYFMCDSQNLKNIPQNLKNNNSYYLSARTIIIDLSGNSIAHLDSIDFGDLTTKLILLNLYNSSVKSIQKNAFDYLTQLKILHLGNNQLKELPPQVFDKLTELRQIDLSNNYLTQLADDAFTAQIYLLYLYLQNNYLQRIGINEIMKISSLRTIGLDANPWSCECTFIEPFRAFVIDPLSAVSNKLELNCTENGEEFNISNFNLEKCLTQLNITILIVSLTFGALLALSMALVFKWRYELQVLVYARYGFRVFHQKQPEEEVESKQYDAFVAYNSADTDFLIKDLMPGLEAIENPYRLCIHERDFPAGSYIQDSIIDAIAMSSRTIIVLSENFVSSGWCRYEFKSAHMQMLQDRCPRVLVILVGEVPGTLDPEMKLYLKTNTYLKWGEKLFWQKLYYAMPDKRVTAPATDIMPMREL